MDKLYNKETEKLYFREGKITYIRPLMEEDLRLEYLAWLNDPLLNKYSARFRTWPTSQNDINSFFQNTKSNNHLVFALCCKKTGKHFGNCSVDNIDWVSRHAHYNVNIGIEKYRVLHYIDSFQVMLEYAFNTLNLNKISGGAEIPDIMNFQKRLGFEQEGVLRQHVYRDGEYQDVVIFSILKEEFLRKNKFAASD